MNNNKTKEFDDTHYTGDPNFTVPEVNEMDGFMETYSPYVDEVLKQLEKNPRKVWTVCDGESDDNTYIHAGYHLSNRIHYFITKEEWESENESYYWIKRDEYPDLG